MRYNVKEVTTDIDNTLDMCGGAWSYFKCTLLTTLLTTLICNNKLFHGAEIVNDLIVIITDKGQLTWSTIGSL